MDSDTSTSGFDLSEAMRTTFAARAYTDDPLPDDVLFDILDVARFAPSGGNRQGAHVTVVRDAETKRRIADLSKPAARRYLAQKAAGESPWNPVGHRQRTRIRRRRRRIRLAAHQRPGGARRVGRPRRRRGDRPGP